jgi:uncharacterized LabA/DUF88 family protein
MALTVHSVCMVGNHEICHTSSSPRYPSLHFGLNAPPRTSQGLRSGRGSDEVLSAVEESLWRIGFTPKVFKKASQERKSKGVDIALCTDMLTHAFQNHFEVAVLLAGDADYKPLVNKVKSLGKIVYLWFFSEKKYGLGAGLRLASDAFISLDSQFAKNWLPR